MSVPRYNQRLESLLFRFKFNEKLSELREQLDLVARAASEVGKSNQAGFMALYVWCSEQCRGALVPWLDARLSMIDGAR